jgi:DNA-binding MarR family transcriptional regulator
MPSDEFRNRFGYIMGRAPRDLVSCLQKKFDEAGCGITVVQWVVLMVLWRHDRISQQQIADAVFKDKTTLTRIIDGLERRGFIARETDKNDRRQKNICLREKGRSLEKRAMHIAFENLDGALTGIPQDRLDICCEVLETISANLK